MATNLKAVENNSENIELNAENFKIGIVVSEWNKEITEALLKGVENTLAKYGAKEENIIVKYVPGSFELTLGAAFFIKYTDVDAVIVLGSVIKGETPHFDYVCQGVTQGITTLNIKHNLPVIFGVLTTNNLEQAQERAGGKLGNKGEECALAALKMIQLQDTFIDDAEFDDYVRDLWDSDFDDDDIFNDEDDLDFENDDIYDNDIYDDDDDLK